MKYKNFLTQTDHGLMLINKNDRVVGKNLSMNGSWEQSYIQVFKKLIAKHFAEDQVVEVIDCGANLGVYSLSLAQMAGMKVKVHAIEVQRLMYQMLNANIALNSLDNVWTHHAAVSDVMSEIQLQYPSMDHIANFGAFEVLSGVRNSDFDGKESMPVETVKTLTIDSLALKHCAFIKLDVEGMENLAIKGALNTIEAARPLVFFERHKTDYGDIKQMLSRFDYNLWELPSFNVLAMRKEWDLKVTPSHKVEL